LIAIAAGAAAARAAVIEKIAAVATGAALLGHERRRDGHEVPRRALHLDEAAHLVLAAGGQDREDRDPVDVGLDLDAKNRADLGAVGYELGLDHSARLTSTSGSPCEAAIRARAGQLDLDPS
jgi:hypothetical protein